MRLLVYDTLVNVNGIYYVHVCEQVHLAHSAGNSAIDNLCIIIVLRAGKGLRLVYFAHHIFVLKARKGLRMVLDSGLLSTEPE